MNLKNLLEMKIENLELISKVYCYVTKLQAATIKKSKIKNLCENSGIENMPQYVRILKCF